MSTKKWCSALLAAAMSLGLMSGCGGGGSSSAASSGAAPASSGEASTASSAADSAAPDASAGGSSGKITLTAPGLTLEDGINVNTKRKAEGWNTYAKTVFKEKFPDVELAVNTIPWDNANGKMQTILTSNATDLFVIGGAFIPLFYQEGLIHGLNDLLDNDPEFKFGEHFPEAFLKNINLTDFTGETICTLPWEMGNRIIVYDKQLFDDWGVEYLSEHPTPEEILEKAAKMTGKNPKTGQQNYGVWFDGKSLNFSYLIPLTEYYGATEAEGSFGDPKNLQWKLNTPEFVKAVQWIVDAAKFAPAGAANTQGAENFGTVNNDIAIRIDTNGVLIMNEAANTQNDALIDRYEPTLHFSKSGGNWTPVDGMAIASGVSDDRLQTAWEALKFITSSMETNKWYYDNFGPNARPFLRATELYDPKDKFMAMNSKVAALSTHPGYEVNPFYSSNMLPAFSSIASRALAGETVDVQAEMDALQKKAVDWSATK